MNSSYFTYTHTHTHTHTHTQKEQLFSSSKHAFCSLIPAIKDEGFLQKGVAPHLGTREGFPGGSGVKNLPVNEGDTGDLGLIPASGRSPGGQHGNPLQCSCLENLMDRGAWWATGHRVAKSQTCAHAHKHKLNLWDAVLNGTGALTGSCQKHAPWLRRLALPRQAWENIDIKTTNDYCEFWEIILEKNNPWVLCDTKRMWSERGKRGGKESSFLKRNTNKCHWNNRIGKIPILQSPL